MEEAYNQSFQNENYQKIPFEIKNYEACTFENCDFQGIDLSGARFIDSIFIECNLSNTTLHKTSLQNAQFKKCKMLGLTFDDCDPFNFSIFTSHSNLSHASFYKMNLTKCLFDNSLLHEADFTETNLKKVKLTFCDFDRAIFERTNLEEADLRNAINYTFDPENNRIYKAKCSLPDVIRLLDKYKLTIEVNNE